MKILFLAASFTPQIGGGEKHIYNVALRLIEKGHSVAVITRKPQTTPTQRKKSYQTPLSSDRRIVNHKKTDKSTHFDTFHDSKIHVFYISAGKNDWFAKFRVWRGLWKVRKLILASDVIHCHDVFFWYLPFRFLFPTKKVYTTFHGYETRFPPSEKAILVRKLCEKLSRGNICVGEYIKKWYGTRPTFTTFGGVEIPDSKFPRSSGIPHSRGQIPKNYKLQTTNYKLLFVGRIEKDTGVEMYAGALKQLKQKKIPFELEVLGDGSLRAEFERFGTVHGFVEDVAKYIKEADVVFASSYLSMLEALVLKKRVIAAYNNPLKEDYLLMSPFKNFVDVASSSDEIVSVLMEESIVEKIEKGYSWARRQTWENVTDLYLRLWHM